MKFTCYLVVSYRGNIRATKRMPTAVKAGELVLPLNINIPNSAFAHYLKHTEINVPDLPQYEAAVELKEEKQ